MVPATLWYATGSTKYSTGHGIDILIIAPELTPTHSNSEVVARRSGQLTPEDKQKLLSQGVRENQSDLAIIKAKHELDKRIKMVEVKCGKLLSREEVIKSIRMLLSSTKKDEGI